MVISLNISIVNSQLSCGYELTPDNCHPYTISMETSVWYFGKEAGLNFNSSPPQVINCSYINQLEGGATISDASGNFLLTINFPFTSFSQTMDLLNVEFNEIINSDGLSGHYSASQNSIIIPQPATNNLYYIFTVGIPLPPPYGKGLNYSIVDVTNPGTVVSKNNMLLSSVSEKITAIKHENNRDVWIIAHEWNSNRFFSYLLTPDGLEQPIISITGTEHTKDNFNNNAIGCLKASPNGCKLALAIYGKGIIELFDFDKSTGDIYNVISSSPEYIGAYGIEFSSNSKMLYLSTNDYCFNSHFNSLLYQFNLNNGSEIFENPILIAADSIIDFLSLQLANDGKIYVALSIRERLPTDGYEYIGVVNNPTRQVLCNFNILNHQVLNGIYLNGGMCRIGLPNFIQSYFFIPKFTYINNCLDDYTYFFLVNRTNVDSVLWDFGDGNFSRNFEPVHQFHNSGIYNIKVTDYFGNIGYEDSLQIKINPLSSLEINGGRDTIILLPDSYVTLDAGNGYNTYNWNDGQIQQMINVSDEGYYWVEVSNKYCCKNIDSIYVQQFNAYAPTTFSPNGDNINDVFEIHYLVNEFEKFQLQVFNRYGQIIFETNDPKIFWNGRLDNNGIELPIEVYIWQIQILFYGGERYIGKGNVTLLR